MDRTLIAFNLPNVITIGIMGALGYTVLALMAQAFQRRAG